jgi:carbohydrate-selective porin OprB
MTVTPNLQYIVNPGGSAVTDDAVAANLRVRLIF